MADVATNNAAAGIAGGFIALADIVRRRTSVATERKTGDIAAATAQTLSTRAAASELPAVPLPDTADVATRLASVAADMALLRLAVREAFERNAADLLAQLADDVLGRESALAPADVAALLRRTLAAFSELEPLAIVIAPGDARAAAVADAVEPSEGSGPPRLFGLPVRIDANLAPGDFIVEVRDGALESLLSIRVQAAVEHALTPAT